VAGMVETFWRHKRVFITGHTGFKGAWLSLWLNKMGAQVTGYALSPTTNPSLFRAAEIDSLVDSHIGDIRDFDKLNACIRGSNPEIVFHLAAQPLVRYSYDHPMETYSVNVMGCVHLLEAVRANPGVKVVVNVTTDKCYENQELDRGYKEADPMGGHDPYSSSKGCAELVTAAYRRSYFSNFTAIATARAGNVIGGGDWATDRLIPDIVRGIAAKEVIKIRNPNAIRPWQYVLEPLAGYLILAQKLWSEGHKVAEAFNFGPDDSDAQNVEWVTKRLLSNWGESSTYDVVVQANQVYEAGKLKLDCAKAKTLLDWRPRWNLDEALRRVVQWHRAFLKDPHSAREMTLRDICDYEKS
jgi:CDP-glucose 4,6-dehydratase